MKLEDLDGNKQKILNNSKEILVVYDYRGMPNGREIRLQPGQVVVIQKAPEKEVEEVEKEVYKPESKFKKKKSEKVEDKEEDKVEEKEDMEDSINTSLPY